uniref:complement factor B-like n=1 Tax=Styela clava TaxID=7725 RepID=UPI0019392DCB|nr:complement factor B-like [Styela clava]
MHNNFAERTCPALGRIPHLRSIRYVRQNRVTNELEDATEPYKYDVRAYYTCEPGYLAIPDNVRFCHGRSREENKTWTREIVCAKSCDERNRGLIDKYNFKCGFHCYTDEHCNYGEVCICDGACGRSCVNAVVDCGDAPIAKDATIEYTGKGLERVAHYICNEGMYTARGDVSRKCTGSGIWDGELIKCERVTCENPIPSIYSMGGWVQNYSPPPYYYNTTLQFSCGTYRRLLGSKIRTCMGDGRWSGIDTVCDYKFRGRKNRCPHPGIPIGGKLFRFAGDVEFPVGRKVEFSCNDGLVMIGEASQQCLFFKQWSGNGAPQCVDPKYSDAPSDVIIKLSESTTYIRPPLNFVQGARDVRMNSQGKIEVYFVIDLSRSIKEKQLRNLIDFAKGLVNRLSRNDTSNTRIRYGIVVFATKPYEMLNVMELPPKKSEDVLDILEEIKIDYHNIRDITKIGTDIELALINLNRKQLANSYQFDDDNIIKRHIFILTDGAHNAGGSPSLARRRIEAEYSTNHTKPPEFYSITSSARNQDSEVRQELKELATNEKNFIYVEDFYKLHKYIDQVTDVREEISLDHTRCGQAGEVGSVRKIIQRGRVIGGQNAVDRAWPWQALITKFDEDLEAAFSDFHLKGGGSLINGQWVLSAAHVFWEFSGLEWEKDIIVTLGITRRPHNFNGLQGSAKLFQPDKIILHDEYQKYKGRLYPASFQNDAALIKLGGEYLVVGGRILMPISFPGFVELTPYIKPVCLPCGSDSCVSQVLMKEDSEGEILIKGSETDEEKCEIECDFLMGKRSPSDVIAVAITGFGHNQTRRHDDNDYLTPSRNLQQAVLRVSDRQLCQDAVEIINKHRKEDDNWLFEHIFTDEMFCATGPDQFGGPTVDACQGDSGGPIIREVHDDATKESCYVQVGIVSWGYGCGQFYVKDHVRHNYPGFYTDVASIMEWIKKTTKTYNV